MDTEIITAYYKIVNSSESDYRDNARELKNIIS